MCGVTRQKRRVRKANLTAEWPQFVPHWEGLFLGNPEILLINPQTSLMLHDCAVTGEINCTIAFSKRHVLSVLTQTHQSSAPRLRAAYQRPCQAGPAPVQSHRFGFILSFSDAGCGIGLCVAHFGAD